MDKRMPTLCVEKDVMFFSDRPLIQALGAQFCEYIISSCGLRENIRQTGEYLDKSSYRSTEMRLFIKRHRYNYLRLATRRVSD